MGTRPMKLFSYCRSQATYRVRVALAIKGLDAELTTLDLLEGDHSPLTQPWMRIA